MSNNSHNCSGSGGSGSSNVAESNGSKQSTPFNIGTFGVLFVFCIIIALTSSLYYNWPAVERILIDDKVFKNLCTKDQILNAIDGMFVCDKQRIEIGNLALVIFYSEFVAFAIGGLLTDIVGVYLVLILGFMFGFGAFIILYFFYLSNRMIKLAFGLWGMFGGLIFITSIQFPKMFPQSKSLSDGMIILFDNLSGLMTLVIHKIMKMFGLKYYEAFGTYILWGVFPAFLLVMAFIPYKIMPKNSTDIFNFSKILEQYKCLGGSLSKHQLWLNLVVFSIPVTCSIFYKKTFSTYFLKNQTLVRLFPIIMLFVFVPTIFIAALNQFMGVHITSTILYIFYIISFVCFLYPTKQYGLLSIILFVISTSAAEQQTMTYISEQHPQNESTLLGISYAVDFLVGSVLQRLFTCIFNRKPKAILFIIVPLFLICIAYSLYCQCGNPSGSSKKSPKFMGLFIILWIVPFIALCLNLLLNSLTGRKQDKSEMQIKTEEFRDYQREKILTVSVVFYSFSFYYVCNTYLILVNILKISKTLYEHRSTHSYLIFLLSCFLFFPQFIVKYRYLIKPKSYINLDPIVFILLILKFIMIYFSEFSDNKFFIGFFCIFLIIYGFVFFQFIYMLAYYNFQITYVDRCYKTSLLHWGSIINIFVLFKLFHSTLSKYEYGYYILSIFNVCFFIFFAMVLRFYFPCEIDRVFSFKGFNLPISLFKYPELSTFKNQSFYIKLVVVTISICNCGLLIDFEINKKIVFIFFLNTLINRLSYIYATKKTQFLDSLSDYHNYSLCALSSVLFVILLIAKIFFKNYSENQLVCILYCINFVVLQITCTFSWLSVQHELQKCCCTKNGSCSCQCCCICKATPKECTCLTTHKDKCCCCCCKPKGKDCKCDPPCCTECQNKKCDNCVCKCVKKIKWVDGYDYVFCFYECHFENVDKYFLSFYFGNLIGWILFIIYIAVSKSQIVYNSFR